MDTIETYSRILSDVVNEYAAIKKTLMPGVQSESLVDRENHHYQLLTVGWHQHRFIYTVIFHFDIIDGKIWIQQNNTDVLIADELIRRGVVKTDIVLGFLSEQARQLMASHEQSSTVV